MSQSNPGQSTLDLLEQYSTFMESIDSLADMGCGNGQDLAWWATRTVLDDDDKEIPLNINCTGIDLHDEMLEAKRLPNVVLEKRDFEADCRESNKYDVIWCNNAFQYVLNPINTLQNWRKLLSTGGMIAMVVPSTVYANRFLLGVEQHEYTYFHYTIVSLIHMFAINGIETAFVKEEDGYIHIVGYKTEHEPFDPQTTRWYHLVDKGLLPDSVEECIERFGYVRLDMLTLPWLNKSLTWYGE